MRTKSLAFVIFASLALVAGGASAQSFSVSPNPSAGQVLPPGGGNGGPCGTVMLTQSVSQTIVPLNSISCNAGGLHTDNSYFRAFDLSADFGITGDFNVCGVDFGIETAAGAAGTQPVTVNLYSGPPGFPTDFPANFPLIGTIDLTVPDQAATILQAAVAATALAGEELVVEVFTPEGQTNGHSFFLGSNPDGENDPSYLAAEACGAATPTATGDIGFPGFQFVINVHGDVAQGPGGGLPIPTLGEWGLLALVLLLAGAATFFLRRG